MFENRDIGGITFSITPEFIAKVRRTFNIADTDPVLDSHILQFFHDATKVAIDKVDRKTT